MGCKVSFVLSKTHPCSQAPPELLCNACLRVTLGQPGNIAICVRVHILVTSVHYTNVCNTVLDLGPHMHLFIASTWDVKQCDH